MHGSGTAAQRQAAASVHGPWLLHASSCDWPPMQGWYWWLLGKHVQRSRQKGRGTGRGMPVSIILQPHAVGRQHAGGGEQQPQRGKSCYLSEGEEQQGGMRMQMVTNRGGIQYSRKQGQYNESSYMYHAPTQ